MKKKLTDANLFWAIIANCKIKNTHVLFVFIGKIISLSNVTDQMVLAQLVFRTFLQ